MLQIYFTIVPNDQYHDVFFYHHKNAKWIIAHNFEIMIQNTTKYDNQYSYLYKAKSLSVYLNSLNNWKPV